MKKKQNTTKGTAATRILHFEKRIKAAGFSRLTIAEKRKTFKRLGIKFPERITDTHHSQRMYVFERDGYRVVINSGILGNELLTPGLSWAMITADSERLFTRAFKSDTSEPSQIMLDRLLAYAKVTKNMITKRPLEERTGKLKELAEKDELFITPQGEEKRRLAHYWVCEHEVDELALKPTNLALYFEGVPTNLRKLFLRKERKLERYFETRAGFLFRKEIRKKSKVTHPKNRIGVSA